MEAVRTCAGCNGKGQRDTLMRIVVQNGQLVRDHEKTMPGRGAWLHPSTACLDTAVHRRALGRALRVSNDIDPIHLREQAERLMDK
jgi:predicted RNA-binding protein YlxR (DUF448 family)